MKFKIGEKVKIFTQYNKSCPVEDRGYGTVIDIQLTDNLSYHGSVWSETFYIVYGDDGKSYKGFKDEWKDPWWNSSYTWFQSI